MELNYHKDEFMKGFFNCLKSFLNGFTLGAKIQIVNLSTISLIKFKGSIKKNIYKIIKKTIIDGIRLGTFGFLYRMIELFLKRIFNSNSKIIFFYAGLLASLPFNKNKLFTKQIILYLLPKVIFALIKRFRKFNMQYFEMGLSFVIYIFCGIIMIFYENNINLFTRPPTKRLNYIINYAKQWKDLPSFIPMLFNKHNSAQISKIK